MNTKLEHQYIRIALIFGIAAASMAASTALAGRNANGALIVHTDDTYSYSTDTACTTPLGNPGTCTGAVTQTNKTSGTVIWVLASFPAGSSPGVSALQFGIQYDASLLNPVLAHGACGFFPQEVSTPDWPAPCSGTAFVYAAPTYANPFACYVFEVDNSCDRPGAWFSTTVHPGTNEAKFLDDGNPPVEDLCGCFGTVRWFAAGWNDCPGITCGQPTGACCLADGACLALSQGECANRGGTNWAGGEDCCGIDCGFDCGTVPVRRSSWGSVRASYR